MLVKADFVKDAGTLLDATLVEAQVRRPSTDAGLGAKSERGPGCGLDAEW